MKIIKRSGSEVTFDISKIMDAVSKANMEVVHSERLSEEQIETISNNVESICKEMNRSLSVEEIQDLVENQIMELSEHLQLQESILLIVIREHLCVNLILQISRY